MAFSSSPSIVTDGLVFYYDMNNLKKSYKGKPVTNQYPLPTPDGSGNVTFPTNGTGTFRRIYTGTYGGYEIQPTDIVYRYDLGVDGCHYHGGAAAIASGQYATMTFDYYISQDAAGYPSTNYLANFENYGGSALGGGVAAPNSTRGIWQTVTLSAGPTAASGTQAMFLYPGSCGGRLANSGYILYKNPQVIFSSSSNDVQAFTSGTRSTTDAIVDLSPYKNTVTINGLTYNSDGTFSFDGSTNYATISTFNGKPTTTMTVDAWIKPQKASVGTGTIRGGAISCTNSMYLGIIDSTDGGTTMSLHFANQTSVSRVTSWNGSIPNNAWSHIAGTYDGSTMRAYLNGVEIYSAAQTGTITDGTYVLGTYGGALTDGVHNFKGVLPNSKIYNRALSAAEINRNFNAHRARYGV